MSEPVPCPSCGALLRLPPGQAMVRCPSCQTVLAVEPADAPPPPPVAPLPFGGPPRPVAKPAPAPARPVRGPVQRARLAPEDPYDVPAEEDEDEKERERKRKIREELAELDEEERRHKREYDELKGLCANARTGMRLIALGSVGSSLVAVLATFFMVSAVIMTPFVLLVLVAGGLMAVHWLLTAIGQIFCLFGPRQVRGTAAAGLACTLGHAFASTAAAVIVVPFIKIDDLHLQGDVTANAIAFNLLVTNVVCNLTVLTDLPVYLLYTFPVDPPAIILVPVMAAALEFAKLSLLGLLTNRYAVIGKDPTLGYHGMRFVYRIFSIVLLGPVVKVVIGLMVAVGIVWVPFLLATVGYFLWWAFAWFAQFQVMMDTVDVITPDRLMDKRDRLDYV